MNRGSKLFIAETGDGEQWYFLSSFISHYGDVVTDGECCDYTISEWTAGYILDVNSEWKDDDPDFYHPPLELWNWIRKEIQWQRKCGVTTIESAKLVFETKLAEYAIK